MLNLFMKKPVTETIIYPSKVPLSVIDTDLNIWNVRAPFRPQLPTSAKAETLLDCKKLAKETTELLRHLDMVLQTLQTIVG
jgi:hypothetical protein